MLAELIIAKTGAINQAPTTKQETKKEHTPIMTTTMKPTEQGTSFLTTPVTESADKIFTLEQRDEEQRWIEESSATFVQREVLPKVEAIDHQEPGVMPALVKQAGEQGLLMIDVPEEY